MAPELIRRIAGRRLRFLKSHGKRYWSESAALGTGPLQRLRDITAGFDPKEADWYRQIRGSTDGVVSNGEREQNLHGLNGHYAYVLDNKEVFGDLLEARGLPTPRHFASFHAGRWHWRAGGEQELRAGLDKGRPIVIKPALGSKGRSIEIARTPGAVTRYRGEDALLTSFVQQADYAQSIFPDALNTVRLLMLRDENGEAITAAAIHRFGTRRSAPVDNFSAGGLVAKVDLATGRMTEAISIAADNRVERHQVHPDSGVAIAGTAVPGWPAVLDLAATLGRAFPYLSYVGWDIAVTGEGPVVIEGNAHPSLRFFQLYDRLLDDGRLRAIFARHIPRARGGVR